MICDYTIALQKRMDDAAALLRASGHRAEAALFHEARSVIERQFERLNTINRLTTGDCTMESER